MRAANHHRGEMSHYSDRLLCRWCQLAAAAGGWCQLAGAGMVQDCQQCCVVVVVVMVMLVAVAGVMDQCSPLVRVHQKTLFLVSIYLGATSVRIGAVN